MSTPYDRTQEQKNIDDSIEDRVVILEVSMKFITAQLDTLLSEVRDMKNRLIEKESNYSNFFTQALIGGSLTLLVTLVVMMIGHITQPTSPTNEPPKPATLSLHSSNTSLIL